MTIGCNGHETETANEAERQQEDPPRRAFLHLLGLLSCALSPYLLVKSANAAAKPLQSPSSIKKKTGRVIAVNSVKNGIVKSLTLTDGSKVKAGERFCVIENRDVLRATQGIDFAKNLLEIEGVLYGDEYIGLRRRMLDIGIELSNEYLALAQERHRFAVGQFDAGLAPKLEMDTAKSALIRTQVECARSQILRQTFELETAAMRTRYAALKSRIAKEGEEVLALVDTEVQIPQSGILTLAVADGVFVLQGQTLATIEIRP